MGKALILKCSRRCRHNIRYKSFRRFQTIQLVAGDWTRLWLNICPDLYATLSIWPPSLLPPLHRPMPPHRAASPLKARLLKISSLRKPLAWSISPTFANGAPKRSSRKTENPALSVGSRLESQRIPVRGLPRQLVMEKGKFTRNVSD